MKAIIALAPLFVLAACGTKSSNTASDVQSVAVSGAILEAVSCTESTQVATTSFDIQVPVATGEASGTLRTVGNEAHFIMAPEQFSCEKGSGETLYKCTQVDAIDPTALVKISVKQGDAGTQAVISYPNHTKRTIDCQIPAASND